VLADLHSVDYKAVGLDGSDGSPAGAFGKVAAAAAVEGVLSVTHCTFP
jgi:hypothetical protein